MRKLGLFWMPIYCTCLLSVILLGNMADLTSAGSVVGCYKDILLCFVKYTGVTSFTFSNSMSKETLTKICKNKDEVVPCLQKLPSKCSLIVQTTMTSSLDRCYIPVCLDKYESCTLEITGIKMPTDPDEVVLEMSMEQQIDMCRSVSTLEECMVPVKKECARTRMSPSKLFTKASRCDQVCLNMFKSCSLNITGIEIPTESDGDVLRMTLEEQIGLCRSIPLMKSCMTPVKVECAETDMSPASLFTTAARCDEVTEQDVCKSYNETEACENGGSCIDVNFYPICECVFGFTGDWCETLNCSVIMENGNMTTLQEECLSAAVSGLDADHIMLSALVLAATLMMRAILH